jgi:hypothetical protein
VLRTEQLLFSSQHAPREAPADEARSGDTTPQQGDPDRVRTQEIWGDPGGEPGRRRRAPAVINS